MGYQSTGYAGTDDQYFCYFILPQRIIVIVKWVFGYPIRKSGIKIHKNILINDSKLS